METKPLILYSRSAVTTDWTCKRKRYWNYEYSGRGLSPATTALPLYFGILIHDGMAAIAAGIDIDEICEAAIKQFRGHLLEGVDDDFESHTFAEEQCALGEGLLRGFYRLHWPRLMEEYEIIFCEQELTYEHDGLTFMAKPDLILRQKETGDLVYLEFKTTSSIKDQWMTSWQTAVQLHSTVRAVEAKLGEKVERVIVQGLYKSYVSQYNRQESIFCYGYHKPGTPPFNKEQWQYVYAAGFKKSPIWKREGGVKRWVEEMPINLLSQQLPQTPPIFVNNDLVDAFFRQCAVRERDIRDARNAIIEAGAEDSQGMLDTYFPQNFEACSPGWGTGCQYKKLCHGNLNDPLKAGFTMRYSHHQMEQDQIDAG
jgi:hypothetical protein